MNFGNRFIEQKVSLESGIFQMTMDEIKPMLCGKSHGDPYACIDCKSSCAFGKRAIELLEHETRGETKPLSGRKLYGSTKKLEAMENYVEAMKQADPAEFVMKKYKTADIRAAKNKIYQWQHNYGTNIGMLSNKIRELKLEISSSEVQSAKEQEKKLAEEPKKEEVQIDEERLTKKQEKEISKNHLEQMRAKLEKECLDIEDEIKEHKKAIEKCEQRMTEIAEESKAIRQVLDIFNKAKERK